MSKNYYTKRKTCHYCRSVEPEESGLTLLKDKVEGAPNPKLFCCVTHMSMWKHERGKSLLSEESYNHCLRVDGQLKQEIDKDDD